MKQVNNGETFELASQTLEFCRHIAGSSKIAAITLVNNHSKTPNERLINEVMLVVRDFQPRMMSYLKTVNNKTIVVLTVDQWIFERDIDRGFLGEAIAGKIIFPYMPLYGKSYLLEKEVEVKKRLILELLENLVVNFPELAHRIQIKPQYFMYEVFYNRIRVFPLMAYDLANLTSWLKQNEEQALSVYRAVLKQLEAEGKIAISDGDVTITKRFIAQCQDPKIKIINLSKNMPRTIFTSIFGVLPQLMNIVSQNTEDFLRTQKINWKRQPDATCRFIDPQKYVFFPTSGGLVSLSDKIDIKGFAERMILKGQDGNIEVEPVGGMLNDVYLINVQSSGGKTKVLAKRFKDWSGLKWFPLTLWSYGARSFAVSGQARLAKECAISEFLRAEGFNVPRILHVSNAERIVFMEFIDGENLSEAIKQYATSKEPAATGDVLSKVGAVGEIFAKVHLHNVSLGDTKPDNVLIKQEGTIFLIDFEQATQDGDKAWDIAVFLYYSGHYLQPFNGNVKAESVAKAFIYGYLKGGGNPSNVRKAGDQKYMRVFSIFTPPSIIRSISEVCKKTEHAEEKVQHPCNMTGNVSNEAEVERTWQGCVTSTGGV